METKTNNVAIFISGQGSNARTIINHFRANNGIKISLLVSNAPQKGAIQISKEEEIELISIKKETFLSNELILQLAEKKIDYIVLAGFLLKIPRNLVEAFPNKIINLHPALLPKFGGKGMYGKHVHQAVFENKEKESGITIHYVNEAYDEGNIIAQFKCQLDVTNTPETIEQKIRALEHKHFSKTIEKLISNEI